MKLPLIFVIIQIFPFVRPFLSPLLSKRFSGPLGHVQTFTHGRTKLRATFAELGKLSLKQVLADIRSDGDNNLDESKRFQGVSIARKSPTVCQFIIANPVNFFKNPDFASQYGVDMDSIDKTEALGKLGEMLPVIYVADTHPEYGTVGFMLNKRSPETVDALYGGGLRCFRDRPLYIGGLSKKGSSFTMIHRIAGFPENRSWKGLPDKPDFRLYFSPDVAMANELCSTNDAKPKDFKFFQWATVWMPRQLEQEYQQRMWITVEAPVELLFEDEDAVCPLYRRVLRSLPDETFALPSVPLVTNLAVPQTNDPGDSDS
mmetsp:Transcript_14226/g.23676  ORF Transcript_14226/g.23676 Transcript_14226/m.23676 type:complete len:316 (+) Transcript_14226:72-1019(+)